MTHYNSVAYIYISTILQIFPDCRKLSVQNSAFGVVARKSREPGLHGSYESSTNHPGAGDFVGFALD